MIQCISVCQDCICLVDDGKLKYSGSSVDEVCLLELTRDLKYMGYLSGRSQESIIMTTSDSGETTKFDILKVFPFTSDRKAMSIVVRGENGKKFVFTKGAYSSMLKFSNQINCDKIINEVEDFASQGLRTLVFGYREL